MMRLHKIFTNTCSANEEIGVHMEHERILGLLQHEPLHLSEKEEKSIGRLIEILNENIIDFYDLKTRKNGNMTCIDFHMILNKKLSEEIAHTLSEDVEKDMKKDVEKDIESALQNTCVSIQIEPYESK